MLKSALAALITSAALLTGTATAHSATLPFKADCSEMQSFFNKRFRSNVKVRASHFEKSEIEYYENSSGIEALCTGGYVISKGRICEAEIGYYDYPKMFYSEGPKLIWNYAASSNCTSGQVNSNKPYYDDSDSYQRVPLSVSDIVPFTVIGIAIGVSILLIRK